MTNKSDSDFKCFCQKTWMQQREQRYLFVEKMIEQELLIGLSKQEVVALLGDEFNDLHSQNWTYYIVKKVSFFFGSKYLYIQFNTDNIVCFVSKHRIYI